jgi:hypothetical protein
MKTAKEFQDEFDKRHHESWNLSRAGVAVIMEEYAQEVSKDCFPREFVEWCLDNEVSKGVIDTIDWKPCYDFIKNGHASYYDTLDELFEYWKTEIKDK